MGGEKVAFVVAGVAVVVFLVGLALLAGMQLGGDEASRDEDSGEAGSPHEEGGEGGEGGEGAAASTDGPAPEDPAEGSWTPSQQAGGMGINVVRGLEVSCSSDPVFFGGSDADLWVTVKVDDRTVLVAKSDDTDEPTFGAWAAVQPKAAGSRVEVLVADDEGGGSSVPCDIQPGAATTAVFTWKGERRSLDLRGDGELAAQVWLELGEAPAVVDMVRATGLTTSSATLEWSAPSPADRFDVVTWRGTVHASATPSQRKLTVDGLCDGMAHRFRVVGVRESWHLGQDVAFELPNAPPAAPRVLTAEGSGSLRVEWEDPSHFDTERFEVYAGPAGFSPSERNLRATDDTPGIYWAENAWFQPEPGDTHVIVRTVDTHGAYADSPAFRIGAPSVEQQTMGKSLCVVGHPDSAA